MVVTMKVIILTPGEMCLKDHCHRLIRCGPWLPLRSLSCFSAACSSSSLNRSILQLPLKFYHLHTPLYPLSLTHTSTTITMSLPMFCSTNS